MGKAEVGVVSFSFCVLSRTEDLLRQPQYLQLLKSFFPFETIERYRCPVDLLFCECFPEWKEPCQRFYAARGGRIYSFGEASPKRLLEWDLFLSGTALPRLKELFLKGRRRWSSVWPELRLPQPPPVRQAQSERMRGLPTSLGIHNACSEALEIARLRGMLCRFIHELVEAARFGDDAWFDASLVKVRRSVESLPPEKFGARVASKVLLERIHYVEKLPAYGGIRTRFLKCLRRSGAPDLGLLAALPGPAHPRPTGKFSA